MKTLSATLAFVAWVAWGTACQAGIIEAIAAADGDHAIECGTTWTANPSWNPEFPLDTDAGDMTIIGEQYGPVGHVGTEGLDGTAHFTVDGDPIVKLITSIENDMSIDWTGYNVNIYMNQPFDVLLPSVTFPGWTVGSYDAAAIPVGDKYLASVHFVGGTPVQFGESLDFSYKVRFTGSVNYCQEMIPVPEPGTIALVLSGLVGLLVVRRKFAR